MIRLAGQALKGTGKFLINNTGNGPLERLLRLGPDAFFAYEAARQNPGDLGDKLIAGGTQLIGGGLTGVVAAGGVRGLANKLPPTMKINPNSLQGLQTAVDVVGSYGGDFGGMIVGDKLQRAKDRILGGSGQTGWERMSSEQQAQFAQELEQRILAEYGLIPGTREQYLVYDDGSGVV
jgi:hypothetical protein|tara:strand:- start:1592 stop:2125 length:534 start_codon:yes stop_codon:yes gene_type:complete